MPFTCSTRAKFFTLYLCLMLAFALIVLSETHRDLHTDKLWVRPGEWVTYRSHAVRPAFVKSFSITGDGDDDIRMVLPPWVAVENGTYYHAHHELKDVPFTPQLSTLDYTFYVPGGGKGNVTSYLNITKLQWSVMIASTAVYQDGTLLWNHFGSLFPEIEPFHFIPINASSGGLILLQFNHYRNYESSTLDAAFTIHTPVLDMTRNGGVYDGSYSYDLTQSSDNAQTFLMSSMGDGGGELIQIDYHPRLSFTIPVFSVVAITFTIGYLWMAIRYLRYRQQNAIIDGAHAPMN